MAHAENLEDLRQKIDSLDSKLVSLLNDRANVSIQMGVLKKSQETKNNTNEPHQPSRERAVLDRLHQLNKGPLTDESLDAIYKEIMSASISLQHDVSVAFLGPNGTFTHQAATGKFGESVVYLPQPTIADVFTATERGQVTYGVIPFENSTYGSVVQTLDRFISTPLKIRAEMYQGIHHCLMSNSAPNAIKRIYSHPEAFGQCQKWLDQNMKGVERVHVSSTAHAAEMASKEVGTAAICSHVCSELFGLNVLYRNIEDLKNNTTRFFVLGANLDSATGNDKTLVLFTVDHRKPGALADALSILKKHDINLSKIDSRPSGQRPWHYYFFIEMSGHALDAKVKDALSEMQETSCLDLKVLGSYRSERPEEK